MRWTIFATFTLSLLAAPAPAQQGTVPQPGWLGLIFEPSPERRGVGIRRVASDSPAARAGLQDGDLVVRIDGRAATLEGMRSLRISAGDTVRFAIRRAGRDRPIQVVAEPRPAGWGARGPAPTTVEVVRRPGTQERVVVIDGDTTRIPMPSDSLIRVITAQMDSVQRRMQVILADSLPVQLRRLEASIPEIRVQVDSLRGQVHVLRPAEAGRHAVAGAEFSDLNPDLAAYFGADRGALVLRVAPGSPAARAGLTAGDVVVRVGGTAVTGVAQMRAQVARAGREAVQMEVIRRGQRRQISLGP